MKFSMTRPVKIVMLGAGGTGGHIAPHLYRLLYALDRPVRFIICDGDVVEEKNLVRQNFIPADLGENVKSLHFILLAAGSLIAFLSMKFIYNIGKKEEDAFAQQISEA